MADKRSASLPRLARPEPVLEAMSYYKAEEAAVQVGCRLRPRCAGVLGVLSCFWDRTDCRLAVCNRKRPGRETVAPSFSVVPIARAILAAVATSWTRRSAYSAER